MLLQEHGCQNDRHHKQEGAASEEEVFPELRAVSDGPVRCNRVKDVQAGENVRSRVRLVKNLDGKGKDIVTFKAGRTQQVAVRIYGGYDQKQGHSCKKENTVLVKFFFVFLKKQINKNRRHINKPQKIGNDKVFDKGNLIVQTDVNYVVRKVCAAFKPQKPGHINQSVEQDERMLIFLKESFHAILFFLLNSVRVMLRVSKNNVPSVL